MESIGETCDSSEFYGKAVIRIIVVMGKVVVVLTNRKSYLKFIYIFKKFRKICVNNSINVALTKCNSLYTIEYVFGTIRFDIKKITRVKLFIRPI